MSLEWGVQLCLLSELGAALSLEWGVRVPDRVQHCPLSGGAGVVSPQMQRAGVVPQGYELELSHSTKCYTRPLFPSQIQLLIDRPANNFVQRHNTVRKLFFESFAPPNAIQCSKNGHNACQTPA